MKMRILSLPFRFMITGALLASCGLNSNKSIDLVQTTVGERLSLVSKLSGAQLAQAETLCYALKFKRTKFFVDYQGDQFTFSHQLDKCQGSQTVSKDMTFELQANNDFRMRYVSSTNIEYLDIVHTDIDGHLSGYCANILAKDEVFNTITLTEGDKKQFSFSNGSLFVTYSHPINQGTDVNDIIYRSESLEFEMDPSSEIYGIVTKFESKEFCPFTENLKKVTQVFKTRADK